MSVYLTSAVYLNYDRKTGKIKVLNHRGGVPDISISCEWDSSSDFARDWNANTLNFSMNSNSQYEEELCYVFIEYIRARGKGKIDSDPTMNQRIKDYLESDLDDDYKEDLIEALKRFGKTVEKNKPISTGLTVTYYWIKVDYQYEIAGWNTKTNKWFKLTPISRIRANSKISIVSPILGMTEELKNNGTNKLSKAVYDGYCSKYAYLISQK